MNLHKEQSFWWIFLKFIIINFWSPLSIFFSDENNIQDHDDDIIFEDFARLRLKGGETDAWKRSMLHKFSILMLQI